jgi:Ca2+/H+ antiporter
MNAVNEEEEEEEDVLGFWNAMFWLAAITALIAVLSEAISDSIQDAANDAGISGKNLFPFSHCLLSFVPSISPSIPSAFPPCYC